VRVTVVEVRFVLNEDELVDLETSASGVPDEIAFLLSAGCEERLLVLADDPNDDNSVDWS